MSAQDNKLFKTHQGGASLIRGKAGPCSTVGSSGGMKAMRGSGG